MRCNEKRFLITLSGVVCGHCGARQYWNEKTASIGKEFHSNDCCVYNEDVNEIENGLFICPGCDKPMILGEAQRFKMKWVCAECAKDEATLKTVLGEA